MNSAGNPEVQVCLLNFKVCPPKFVLAASPEKKKSAPFEQDRLVFEKKSWLQVNHLKLWGIEAMPRTFFIFPNGKFGFICRWCRISSIFPVFWGYVWHSGDEDAWWSQHVMHWFLNPFHLSGGLSITLGSTTWILKPPEVAHVTNHYMLSAVFRDEEKMKAEMVLVCYTTVYAYIGFTTYHSITGWSDDVDLDKSFSPGHKFLIWKYGKNRLDDENHPATKTPRYSVPDQLPTKSNSDYSCTFWAEQIWKTATKPSAIQSQTSQKVPSNKSSQKTSCNRLTLPVASRGVI